MAVEQEDLVIGKTIKKYKTMNTDTLIKKYEKAKGDVLDNWQECKEDVHKTMWEAYNLAYGQILSDLKELKEEPKGLRWEPVSFDSFTDELHFRLEYHISIGNTPRIALTFALADCQYLYPAAQPVDSSHSQDQNNDLATQVYKALKSYGAEIGNASIGLIQRVINESSLIPDPSNSDKDVEGMEDEDFLQFCNFSKLYGEIVMQIAMDIDNTTDYNEGEKYLRELYRRLKENGAYKAAQSSPKNGNAFLCYDEDQKQREKCKVQCGVCERYEAVKKVNPSSPVEAAQPQQPKETAADIINSYDFTGPDGNIDYNSIREAMEKYADQLYGAKEQPSSKVLQAEELQPIDYYRAGYKEYRGFTSNAVPFDEAAELTMEKGFRSFLAASPNLVTKKTDK